MEHITVLVVSSLFSYWFVLFPFSIFFLFLLSLSCSLSTRCTNCSKQVRRGSHVYCSYCITPLASSCKTDSDISTIMESPFFSHFVSSPLALICWISYTLCCLDCACCKFSSTVQSNLSLGFASTLQVSIQCGHVGFCADFIKTGLTLKLWDYEC